MQPGISLALTDDVVVAVFARARELGLLENAPVNTPWLTTEQTADYLGCSKGQVLNLVSEDGFLAAIRRAIRPGSGEQTWTPTWRPRESSGLDLWVPRC